MTNPKRLRGHIENFASCETHYIVEGWVAVDDNSRAEGPLTLFLDDSPVGNLKLYPRPDLMSTGIQGGNAAFAAAIRIDCVVDVPTIVQIKSNNYDSVSFNRIEIRRFVPSGKIDVVEGAHVRGWVRDPAAQVVPGHSRLLINNQLSIPLDLSIPRDDIHLSSVDHDQRWGFEVDIRHALGTEFDRLLAPDIHTSRSAVNLTLVSGDLILDIYPDVESPHTGIVTEIPGRSTDSPASNEMNLSKPRNSNTIREAQMTSDLRIGSENEQDHISLIRNSHFFDSNWYYFENDDVSQTQIDAALHYYYNGWKEHRSPSYYFDNDAYMRDAGLTYSMNINPIVHYILIGTVLGLKLRCLATSHRRWPKAASRDSS